MGTGRGAGCWKECCVAAKEKAWRPHRETSWGRLNGWCAFLPTPGTHPGEMSFYLTISLQGRYIVKVCKSRIPAQQGTLQNTWQSRAKYLNEKRGREKQFPEPFMLPGMWGYLLWILLKIWLGRRLKNINDSEDHCIHADKRNYGFVWKMAALHGGQRYGWSHREGKSQFPIIKKRSVGTKGNAVEEEGILAEKAAGKIQPGRQNRGTVEEKFL